MTDPMIGQVLDDRYEVVRPLGAGAMGAVYLARQVWLDRPVALKVLKPDLPVDARARRRLHREARVVGRISNPHVVQVFDYGQTSDRAPYLVMEYVRGRGPDIVLEGAAGLAPILAAFDGVLSGLAAAHGRGVLHRDLKPENMILRGGDPAGLVLLDFGIAAVLGRDEQATQSIERDHDPEDANLTRAGTVMGTPLYMSPEQARGLPASERSDLYSAGVVLYRWVSGRPPFTGGVREILRAHVFDPPPRLEPRPGVVLPDGFRRVLGRALSKEPSARYGSAAEFRDALRRLLGGAPEPVARPAPAGARPRVADTVPAEALSAEPRPATGRVPSDPPFVGRADELEWLGDRLADVTAGRGGLVLVEGVAGSGRSRLVGRALEPYASSGRAMVGRAVASPSGGGALELIRLCLEDLIRTRRMSRDGVARRLRELVSGGREGLSQEECDHLASWLRGGSASSADPVRPETPLEWQEHALVERVLRVLATDRVVVLWLDDLDLADGATIAFLTRLAISLRINPFPLLVIATRAVGSDAAAVALDRYAGDVLQRLRLEELSLAHVEELLRGVLPLEDSTASRIASRADGSPLVAVQLLRHLVTGGLLVLDAGRWRFGTGVEPAALVPESLEQMLAARLDDAAARSTDPERVRAVLEAAAVLGPTLEVPQLEVVLAAVGASTAGAALDELLDDLVDSGVFSEPGGALDRLQWSHGLLRELTLSRMGRSRRGRRLCRAAAETLIADGSPRDVARPVVELLLLAGDRDAAAEHASTAGDQALAAGGLAEAVRLYDLAIERGAPADREAALWGRGNAENHRGHTDAAEASFSAILDREPGELERGWAWFGVGRCRYNRGEQHPALDALGKALACFEQLDGPAAATGLSRTMRTIAAVVRELPGVPMPEPDLEGLLARASGPAQRCEHLTTLGYVALVGGDRPGAVQWLSQALREARAGGAAPSLPDILCDLGRACRVAGDLDAAAQHLGEGLELARTTGQHRTEAELHNELGELARERGELKEASRQYASAVLLWRLLGSRNLLIGSLNQALVAVERARPEEALEVLGDVDEPADGPWRPAWLLTRALALAAAGNAADAAGCMEEGVELQGRFEPPHDEAIAVLESLAATWQAEGQLVLCGRADGLAESLKVRA